MNLLARYMEMRRLVGGWMVHVLVVGGLLVGGAALSACNSEEDLPKETATDASGASLSSGAEVDSPIQDPNVLLAEIAAEVPGFAGYTFDPSTTSYVIQSTIPNIDVEAVKRAILKRDPARATVFEGATFRVEEVEYDAVQLNAWYVEMKNVVIGELPAELRYDWQFADLDEGNNRILVGFSTEEAQAWARKQIAEKIDAPPGAIVVIHHPPGELD